jgi:flavodoxin
MKTAIICYSHTHNNLVLAGEILARTGATLFNIEEKKSRTKLTIFLDLFFNRTPRIKDYFHVSGRFDHYILIAPIWAGKIATPLKAFVLKERGIIESYSFITLCGGGGERQVSKISKELTCLIGRPPVKVAELSLAKFLESKPAGILDLRINREQLQFFEKQIEEFTNEINKEAPV